MIISDEVTGSLEHNVEKEGHKNSPLFFAPALDDRFYAESYELRKAASTMTKASIEWFQSNLTVLMQS